MFRELVWQKSRELYRDMPWRRDTRPYYVLVSEIMLQQTQVDRVIPKFEAFIARFQDERELASAELGGVLRLWQGLGYNRRAKYLHDAAKMIMNEHGGVFPTDKKDIMRLPGVGANTMGAIYAYAFNQPSIFIETNVRAVYAHHFFGDRVDIDDKEIRAILEETVDAEHPREWYWALMDYGAWLKRHGAGSPGRSKHYVKQSALRGSVREVRGEIIRELSVMDMTRSQLAKQVAKDDRFDKALGGLIRDGLVSQTGDILHLTK